MNLILDRQFKVATDQLGLYDVVTLREAGLCDISIVVVVRRTFCSGSYSLWDSVSEPGRRQAMTRTFMVMILIRYFS
jgi:hypothetical protein